ncbi:hypothetical protein AB4Y64_17680 [Lysobacter sp. TAF61]|uniref:hypothetical protein n=1 Tax=Lysobacter sp. TAF61 TaxID=3233072 RepID=UPI003F97156E
MNITEYDVVRVISDIPAERVDKSVGQCLPRVGDLGAVILAHATEPQQEPAFVVECVGSDGHTIWLADIFARELERVPPTLGVA